MVWPLLQLARSMQSARNLSQLLSDLSEITERFHDEAAVRTHHALTIPPTGAAHPQHDACGVHDGLGL